jgi:hypothetical protein
MWQSFKNCQMACKLRYIDHLVPIEKDHNMAFGTVIHECLYKWHSGDVITNIHNHLDSRYKNRTTDVRALSDWHLAMAIMNEYDRRYDRSEFDAINLEKVFRGPIINPRTCHKSASFELCGKVDGIVKKNNEYYLIEHKTASIIDNNYIGKLWSDFQVILYSWYLKKYCDIPIVGVIYNVISKARLIQKQPESMNDFIKRRDALLKKSKSGTSNAKIQIGESDSDFSKRLEEYYTQETSMIRIQLYIADSDYTEMLNELWYLSKAFLRTRNLNSWYRNTARCFLYSRPCQYYNICSSNGNRNVISNFYEKRDPHSELFELNEYASANV